MPITDLTGTTWVGDNGLALFNILGYSFSITFTSNGVLYSSFQCSEMDESIWYDNTSVYTDMFGWSNTAYKTIQITGGTDATNSTLISWLEANGTLTAPQPQPTGTNNIWLGTTKLAKAFVGNSEIASMWLGNTKIYEKGSSPTPTYTWTCTVSNLGSQDPTNVSFTNDGTMPTFEETTIGTDVFIKIPTMYKKVNSVVDNQITSFTIADGKVDNDYQPYPCFLDESGNLLEYILIGKYFISSTTTANSVNATASTMAIGTARTLCRAKGTGYLLYDWMIHKLWQDLIICAKQTVNTNSGTAWTTDELGIYWGTKGCWVDGLTYNSGAIAVSYKPSAYVDSPTSSTTDYNTVNYTMPSSTSNANITKLGYDSSHPFVNMPTTASGSSYTTYYCDGFYGGGSNNRPFYAYIGYALADRGAFNSYFNSGWTSTGACRLCLRPIA